MLVADTLDDAVAAALAGEEAGFQALYRCLQPPLLRYLRTVIGDDAEDVASETWTDVIRGLHKFRGGGQGFRGWLFTIARHRAIDTGRRRGRSRTVANGSAHPPGTATTPSAEDESLAGMRTRQAITLVAGLPPRQAEVVALRMIGGLDTPTTAAVLRTSVESVRVNLHRGMRAIAAHPGIQQLQETVS